MRVLYCQCANGVSGDMLLGALVDAGASLDAIQATIDIALGAGAVVLEQQDVTRAGIRATHVNVRTLREPTAHTGHTPLRSLIDRVQESALPPSVAEPACAVLRRIGEAEARVHGGDPDTVELAELGSDDTLADVVGTIAGIQELGADVIYASPLALGSGRVKTQHGWLAVPVPGVLELVRIAGAPVLPAAPNAGVTGEIVTPTGAALVTVLASFEAPPPMTITATGYGAGTKNPPDRSNAVTVWLGETAGASVRTARMVTVETTIDDMNPEMYGYVREQLIATGARDVWLTPVQMKKGRPGVTITAIGPEGTESRLAETLLRESSTLGVRVTPVTRYEAEREVVSIDTPYGIARVKVKRLQGRVVSTAPEYDDCQRIAQERKIPIQDVYRAIQRAAEDWTRAEPESRR